VLKVTVTSPDEWEFIFHRKKRRDTKGQQSITELKSSTQQQQQQQQPQPISSNLILNLLQTPALWVHTNSLLFFFCYFDSLECEEI
jgi:hypothetical protein